MRHNFITPELPPRLILESTVMPLPAHKHNPYRMHIFKTERFQRVLFIPKSNHEWLRGLERVPANVSTFLTWFCNFCRKIILYILRLSFPPLSFYIHKILFISLQTTRTSYPQNAPMCNFLLLRIVMQRRSFAKQILNSGTRTLESQVFIDFIP